MPEAQAQTYVASWPPSNSSHRALLISGVCLGASVFSIFRISVLLGGAIGSSLLLAFLAASLICGLTTSVSVLCTQTRPRLTGLFNCVRKNPRSSFMLTGGLSLAASALLFFLAVSHLSLGLPVLLACTGAIAAALAIDRHGLGWSWPRANLPLCIWPLLVALLVGTGLVLSSPNLNARHRAAEPALDGLALSDLFSNLTSATSFVYAAAAFASGALFQLHYAANSELSRLVDGVLPAVTGALITATVTLLVASQMVGFQSYFRHDFVRAKEHLIELVIVLFVASFAVPLALASGCKASPRRSLRVFAANTVGFFLMAAGLNLVGWTSLPPVQTFGSITTLGGLCLLLGSAGAVKCCLALDDRRTERGAVKALVDEEVTHCEICVQNDNELFASADELRENDELLEPPSLPDPEEGIVIAVEDRNGVSE